MKVVFTPRHKQSLMWMVLSLVPLGQASIDFYSASLPAIQKDLQTTTHAVQQSLAVYMMAFGLLQLLYGPISDRVGRRPCLIVGFLIYLFGLALAYLAPSIEIFLLARFIQGAGIACASVLFKSIASDAFSTEEMKNFSTYVAAVWGLTPILAPVIGSYVAELWGWRADFIALFLIGGTILGICFQYLPETLPKALTWNMRDFRLEIVEILSSSKFWYCILGMGSVYANIVLVITIAPFFVQDLLHHTQHFYSYMVMLYGGCYFVGAWITRYCQHRLGEIRLQNIGLCLLASSTVLFGLQSILSPPTIIGLMFPLWASALSLGILNPLFMGKAYRLFPDKAGTTNALLGVVVSGFAGLVSYAGSLFSPTNSLAWAGLTSALVAISLIVSARLRQLDS